MDGKIIISTLIVFIIVSLIISVFVESKHSKTEKKFNNLNKRAVDLMPYIHNKNSGDDIKTYTDEFEKVEGFKPNYIGWGDPNV